MNLSDFLAQQVSIISDSSSPVPQIYVLSDSYDYPERSESNSPNEFLSYSPKQFRTEFLARKHLILVYQGANIVLGLTAFEYAHIPVVASDACGLRWSRAYIQYIDSTGLFQARQNQSHLTKSLVRAYALYCANQLNMESIHLLATAKPSFLFAGSEFIEEKRSLPAVKLVNWWLNLVQSLVADGLPKDTQVYVNSPFEEANGSSKLKKRVSSMGSQWHYGFPFDAKAPCIDHIPLFEDDPKYRHFEASLQDDDAVLEEADKLNRKKPRVVVDSEDEQELMKPKKPKQNKAACRMTVKEFFASLQIRPEFRNDPSAFIIITFPSRLFDSQKIKNEPITKKSNLATFGCKLLSGLTFESPQEAKKSSQKISSWMKLMSIKPVTLSNFITPSSIDTENIPPPDTVVPQVNSLQGLIKRKPVTS